MPSDDFIELCRELLQPLGSVRVKRMFGGHGVYVDELFIAIVIRQRLYLKADAATRAAFATAGCEPFSYMADGKTMTMAYFAAPAQALESPPLMLPWARLALAAALRARAAKPLSAKRRPATKVVTKAARKTPAR